MAEMTDNSIILPGERVDDLQCNGLRIIQSPASFCFGTDSVLLAHFALRGLEKASKRSRLADLGAGSGVLSLLINARTGIPVTAIELDSAACDRFQRTLELNGAGAGITVLNADYLDPSLEPGRKFDFAVCNPPYFRRDQGGLSKSASATHELTADIGVICKAAARLIKFGGKLFLCFPAERLAEAITALAASGLEPKLMRLVKTRPGQRPYLALIRANRGAKPGLIIENELVIYDENGAYTEEVDGYYNER